MASWHIPPSQAGGELTETVAAICTLALVQGVVLRDGDVHPRARPMREALRRHVPVVDADRRQDGDIAAVLALVPAGGLPIEEPLSVN
jgi:histidine ammonia-lyase